MSNDKHTPTPWTDEIFTPIPAGDDRVLLGAFNLPSKIPLRVLSEANYQHAAKCVNEYDELTETIATLRAEKAELIEALRVVKDRLQIVISEPNGLVRETMINNLLIDLP
jgi:hypothetical protein